MRLCLPLILMIFALFLPANALEVEITSGCLYLDDLYGADYPHTSVQCGIKAGEKKAVAPQSIATALKRASLPYDAAIPPATVIRKGGAVSEQRVLNDIHKLFAARYPNFEIKVDYVRFGRELFSEDPLTYELELDMQRFGVSNGVIRTGNAKYSFTYMVKAFAEVNVAAERINPGELLAGKAIKEVREITALRNPPIADLSDLTAKKAIQKGKIITEDLSLPKPDRVKGEPIQLIYKDGDLIIEISAVAAGDAVQGKIFPVLNPINSKIVNARYLGNGRAQIYY